MVDKSFVSMAVTSLGQRLDDETMRAAVLAYNLRWSWDPNTINLFRRLDRPLRESSGHKPVLMLGGISQDQLQELAQDDAFVAHLDTVAAALRAYVANPRTWYQKEHGLPSRRSTSRRGSARAR